jgi:nucleoside-triphosphatase
MTTVARVLLTGPPGSGKTTFTRRVIEVLRERGEVLAGFTTSEIRRGGRRTGFVVTGIGGLERTLALRGAEGPQVGAYGVDVAAFDEVAIVEVANGIELGSTLVCDEIGKMELLSPAFRELVPKIFEAQRVLATVPTARIPLVDTVKRRPDVRLVTVEPALDPFAIADVVVDVRDIG